MDFQEEDSVCHYTIAKCVWSHKKELYIQFWISTKQTKITFELCNLSWWEQNGIHLNKNEKKNTLRRYHDHTYNLMQGQTDRQTDRQHTTGSKDIHVCIYITYKFGISWYFNQILHHMSTKHDTKKQYSLL